MSGPNNGKDVISPHRPAEVWGECMTYAEADPPIVPMMLPSQLVAGSAADMTTVGRYRWSVQVIQASRVIRYYYQREPRLVQLEISMDFGFPPSLPMAAYSGMCVMDGYTSATHAVFEFRDVQTYSGTERGRLNWSTDIPWERWEYGTLVDQLERGGDIGFDVDGDPVFAGITMKQAGVGHLRQTLRQATNDLAAQRGMGVVASRA